MGRRAGAPTVRPRGTAWQARFRIDGVRYEVRTGLDLSVDEGRAQAEAEKLYAQALLAARADAAARRQRPQGVVHPLDELYERYFGWLASQGKDARYVNEQKLHWRAHFLRTDAEGRPTRWLYLEDVTSEAIAAYQAERSCVSTVTLYKELVSLSQLLRWAKREKLLEAIPEFTRPRQVSDYAPPDLSPERVQRFLRALPERETDPQGHPVREWATFTWAMALRLTESRKVEWRDVDLKAKRLVVRAEIDKAGRTWVLPLAREALRVLQEERRRAGGSKATGPIWPVPRSMGEKLGEVAARLHLPHITAHHLRHFRASELANATRRLASVQYFLRHTSIATTALYVRSRAEAAAEMLLEADGRRRR